MGLLRGRWQDRFGLRARMAVSYVLVTAAAVLVVEVAAIGVILPSYQAQQDLNSRVVITAADEADRVAAASLSSTSLVLPSGFTMGDSSATVSPGQVVDEGQGLAVPQITRTIPSNEAPLTVAVLLSTDGTVLASSYPAAFPVGSSIDSYGPIGRKGINGGLKGATFDTSSGKIAWAVQPVLVQLMKNSGRIINGVKPTTPDAFVYVQAPVQTFAIATSFDAVQPLLAAGLVVLLLALPVGLLFGLLSTRGMVRRLRRLAGTTATVAEGDFTQRVTPGPADEVGRLERNFNDMAERLAGAISRQRMLADRSARQAERNRISRELHDSISQDLFSISLLAAGLAEALPEESPLRDQVRSLVDTTEATNREMRALLLELRPASLEERGLIPALEELASAYMVRLGVKVDVDLEPIRLAPAAELAALRIAQEGLANAVKHAHAANIKLQLHLSDGSVDITVIDDGKGFDPGNNGAAEGLGLRLMRERVEELGGTLAISSRAGQGTVVSASIPGMIE